VIVISAAVIIVKAMSMRIGSSWFDRATAFDVPRIRLLYRTNLRWRL
jgi:hypothetical protein